MKRFKGTLLPALLCVVLLVTVFVTTRSEKNSVSDDKYMFHHDEAKIHQIILTEGDAEICGVRGDRKWILHRPVRSLGAKSVWNDMALTLSRLSYERIVDEKGENLEMFGLQTPIMVVTFMEENGDVNKVEFGNENPTGQFYYARVGNSPKVYLVSKAHREPFTSNLAELRENHALDFDVDTVVGITLQKPSGTFQFGKSMNHWVAESPLNAPADRTELKNMLHKLSREEVANHLDGIDRHRIEQLFGGVRYRLTIFSEKQTERVLEVGSPSPFERSGREVLVYNKNRDEFFTLSSSFLEILEIAFESLLNYNLVKVDPSAVKGITAISSNKRVLLSRKKDGNWRWRHGREIIQLDPRKIDKFIHSLNRLRIQRYFDEPDRLEKYGLRNPSLKILIDLENSEVITLLFGREDKDTVYALNPAFSSLIAISSEDWSLLRFEPEKWRLE